MILKNPTWHQMPGQRRKVPKVPVYQCGQQSLAALHDSQGQQVLLLSTILPSLLFLIITIVCTSNIDIFLDKVVQLRHYIGHYLLYRWYVESYDIVQYMQILQGLLQFGSFLSTLFFPCLSFSNCLLNFSNKQVFGAAFFRLEIGFFL